MSAIHNPEDGILILTAFNERDRKLAITVFESYFDERCDFDIMQAHLVKNSEKLFRRSTWVRVLLYPLEYVVTLFLMGFAESKEKSRMNKASIAFLRNKITLNQYSEILNDSADAMLDLFKKRSSS